jgi:hypothetical protein
MDGYARMISYNIRRLTNEINGKGVLVKPSIRSNELADLERARRSCWMQGFDLDFIEEIFLSCKPNLLKGRALVHVRIWLSCGTKYPTKFRRGRRRGVVSTTGSSKISYLF